LTSCGSRAKALAAASVIILVVVFVLVGGMIVLFQTVLAPSPEVVARLEAQDNAYEALDTGDYRQAVSDDRSRPSPSAG